MLLALATAAALLSLATALASVLSRRDSLREVELLRRQVASLSQRLQDAERAVEQAAGRAEAAGQLLLDKGIASEGELAEMGEPEPQRSPRAAGSRTVH